MGGLQHLLASLQWSLPPPPSVSWIPGVTTPTRGNWFLNDMRNISDMIHSEFSSSFAVLQCFPWQPPSFSLPTCLAYLKVFWPLSNIKIVQKGSVQIKYQSVIH